MNINDLRYAITELNQNIAPYHYKVARRNNYTAIDLYEGTKCLRCIDCNEKNERLLERTLDDYEHVLTLL